MKQLEPKILRITTVPVSLKYLLKGQFAFIQKNGFSIQIASSDGPEAYEVAIDEGVKFISIPLTRTISPIKDIYAVYRLYRYIKTENFDIIHSHTPKAGVVAMLAAWFARTPVRMHTVAGLPLMVATGFKKRILTIVEKMTYAFATNVYPNSTGLLNYILDEFKPNHSEKFKVLANGSSNGIDMNFFKPNATLLSEATEIRKQLKIPRESKVGIFVGRVVKDKGVEELIRVVVDIFKRNDHFNLIIVGPYEQELDPIAPEIIQQIESHPRIHAVGFQLNVRSYFLASDFLIFPSHREGFPNAVLQSMAMERPAIVSNINGCNEIIMDNFNGLIFEPRDEFDLKSKVEIMINDNKEFERLKSNTRNDLMNRFSQEVVWQAILDEYRTLLGYV